MKKILAVLLSFCVSITFIYSEKYRISEGNYTTEGKFKLATTKPYILDMKYPLDKKTIFTEDQLNSYISNYSQELKNSRFFQEISVDYELTGETERKTIKDVEEEITLVKVNVSVVDSNHFLLIPYATLKDDLSETKLTPKIKAKDTNFLGSMNPLNAEFNIEIFKKSNEGFWKFKPGINISYDYPFKAGPVDLTWVNAYALDFTFGENTPEWQIKTGLKASLPINKVTLVLEGYQYFYRENDYITYNDEVYFANEAQFSTPVTLYRFKNFSNLTYTPYVNFLYNYDINSINPNNDNLVSPIINFGHQISNSKIDWFDNFRKGYSYTLKNTWPYNFYTRDWYPSISFEGLLFQYYKLEDRNYLDKVGFAVDFYAFHYFDFGSQRYPSANSGYGEKIGPRLRGVTDDSYFGNQKIPYTTSTAVVINIDLPINIISTNFKHDIINFDMQFSPFMDIAIYRDRALPLQTDSVICAGMEVLVYPKKWSSFTIRASIGFDLKKAISENNMIKGLWHNKEFSIGLGLHY